MLGVDSRASYKLSRCSTTELYPQFSLFLGQDSYPRSSLEKVHKGEVSLRYDVNTFCESQGSGH